MWITFTRSATEFTMNWEKVRGEQRFGSAIGEMIKQVEQLICINTHIIMVADQ